MISVVIPLMAVPPYDRQVHNLLACLKEQTAEHEVIVCEQEVREHINKNHLLNQGVASAKGEFIWFCDADFILEDITLMARMRSRLLYSPLEVIFPMFRRKTIKELYKIAEGAPFMKREVVERHGPLDETILGISYTTFPFLKWCMENTYWLCSRDYLIHHDWTDVKVKGWSSNFN